MSYGGEKLDAGGVGRRSEHAHFSLLRCPDDADVARYLREEEDDDEEEEEREPAALRWMGEGREKRSMSTSTSACGSLLKSGRSTAGRPDPDGTAAAKMRCGWWGATAPSRWRS